MNNSIGENSDVTEAVAPEAKKPRLEAEQKEVDSEAKNMSATGLPNPHLDSLDSDFLYHIGYSNEDCVREFKDVKFVVAGGASGRMGAFAELIAKELGHPVQSKEELTIAKTDRFAFFKIGPVLSISHGMGVPSITIMLHEIIKLLKYSGAVDPVIIRIGTSGGIGVPAGTVVITNKAFNVFLKEQHDTVILGKVVPRPTTMDQDVAKEIKACQNDNGFQTILGGTMCTDDFYESQGRVDGAVCEFTEQDKLDYLTKVHEAGVSNIEMECTAIASLCQKTEVKCAVVCVTLLNRLLGDQVTISKEEYKMFQQRPLDLVTKFIKKRLNK